MKCVCYLVVTLWYNLYLCHKVESSGYMQHQSDFFPIFDAAGNGLCLLGLHIINLVRITIVCAIPYSTAKGQLLNEQAYQCSDTQQTRALVNCRKK